LYRILRKWFRLTNFWNRAALSPPYRRSGAVNVVE
jgi:hypothetical protein